MKNMNGIKKMERVKLYLCEYCIFTPKLINKNIIMINNTIPSFL